MSINITFPDNTGEITDAIRKTIGRAVIFHSQTSISECGSCSLDPISRKSTDSFCSECGGNYFIPVFADVVVTGHVTWKGTDLFNWQTGGQLFEGDCRIQIKYTLRNLQLVTVTGYVTVDGQDFSMKSKIFRGVPESNRIIVDLELK